MSVYFNRKEELKEKANKHYKEMEELLREETAECVKNTTVYGGNGESVSAAAKRKEDKDMTDEMADTVETIEKPEIFVDKLDSVKSMLQHRHGRLFGAGRMPVPCIKSLQCAEKIFGLL